MEDAIATLSHRRYAQRWTPEVAANNTSFMLTERRTYRRDALDDFKRYFGGWNISNQHYWAISNIFSNPLIACRNRLDLGFYVPSSNEDDDWFCNIGFMILAAIYLGIQENPMYREIEDLINRVEATPADVARGCYYLRPSGHTTIEKQEFNLLCNMMEVVIEERYQDAGSIL